jgi:hypothetical protein
VFIANAIESVKLSSGLVAQLVEVECMEKLDLDRLWETFIRF